MSELIILDPSEQHALDALAEGSITHTAVADHLQAALDLLRISGWIKGSYHLGGQHCMVGAIQSPNSHRMHYDKRTEEAALTRLATTMRSSNYRVYLTDWNDEEDRTFAEVEELFMQVIDEERKAAAEAGELA
jgi:hypothetical protein